MERCTNCGKRIGTTEQSWSGEYCDGFLTMGANPFAVEIYGDYTEYEDCEGNRYESAMDI